MAEGTKEERIAKLRAVSEQRKRGAYERAETAVRKILLNGERLSFASVAREANLSIAYLYKYPELRRRIQQLRSQQEEQGRNKIKPPPASDKSQQVVIQHLRARIKELESERDAQKKQIVSLSGQLYDLSSAKEGFERLREDNVRLSKRVEELERSHSGTFPPSLPAMEISGAVKAGLTGINIRLTASLCEKVSGYPEPQVLNAIAVVREAAAAAEVRSTVRLFIRALEEGWEPAEETAAKQEAREFSKWFDAARAKGLVQASRGTPAGIVVLTAEKKWVPYQELRNRAPVLQIVRDLSEKECKRDAR